MMMTCKFVTHKRTKELIFLQANTIVIPLDMTLTCKAKAVIRKFSEFKNEKLTFESR
jgi:hypothetical protein